MASPLHRSDATASLPARDSTSRCNDSCYYLWSRSTRSSLTAVTRFDFALPGLSNRPRHTAVSPGSGPVAGRAEAAPRNPALALWSRTYRKPGRSSPPPNCYCTERTAVCAHEQHNPVQSHAQIASVLGRPTVCVGSCVLAYTATTEPQRVLWWFENRGPKTWP